VNDDYNPPPMRAPYKGVLPYFEQDAEFFFGREPETELICEILRSARLTVLFGARGIGKTSLLRAGVVPHLKHTATQPERVIVFDSWHDNPLARFTNSLRQLGRERLPNFLSLDSVLKTFAHDETLLIIFDQFEECAVRHQPFAAELAQLASQSDAPMHFLLSVRDEAEPALRSLQARLPNLFSSMLRLLPLSSDAARRSIVGPIEVFNSRNPGLETRIEPAAIEAILESAKNPAANNLKIDTAKLQRILAALWDYEFNSGVDTMRLSSLNALTAEDSAAAQKDGELLDDVRPSTIIASQEHLPYSVPVLTAQAQEVRKQSWFPVYATALATAVAIAVIYLARAPETETDVAVAVPPRIAPLPAPEPQAAAPETAPTPVPDTISPPPPAPKVATPPPWPKAATPPPPSAPEVAAPPSKPRATTPSPEPAATGAAGRMAPKQAPTPNAETLAASSADSAMPPSAPEVVAPPPDAPQKPAPETNRVETPEFGAKGRREETVPPAGSSAKTGTPQLALAPRTENPPRFEIEEQTADDNRDEAAESGTKNPPVVKREKTAPKSEMPQYAAAAPGESKPDTRRERVKAADAPVKREFSPPASAPAEASVFIHVREESPANARLIQKLEKNGIDVSGIKKVDRGPRAIDLRYFRPSEKKEANEIAKELKRLDIQVAEVKYMKGYEEIAKNRQYELWFPAEAFQ
jgi:hypothetical protein